MCLNPLSLCCLAIIFLVAYQLFYYMHSFSTVNDASTHFENARAQYERAQTLVHTVASSIADATRRKGGVDD